MSILGFSFIKDFHSHVEEVKFSNANFMAKFDSLVKILNMFSEILIQSCGYKNISIICC